MPNMLCCRLIRIASCIVSHGFQKATYRCLVLRRDAAIAFHQLLVVLAQASNWYRGPSPRDDVKDVDSQLCYSREICSIGVPCSPFVTPLGIAIFTTNKRQILLLQVEPDSFFPKAIPCVARYILHKRTIFQSFILYKTK